MAGSTTAMCSSFKRDLPMGLHCFGATVTPTGTPTSAAFTLTSMSALTGLALGMPASGTNIAAGAVLASIDSGTQVTLSKASSGSPGSVTVTFTGDVFKIALGKVSPTGTYGAATTNYTDLTGNSDEVTGTGYSAGGAVLAANQSPALTSTTAYWQWSTNPSWTSATISTTFALVYNSSRRSATATLACAVYDFGGTNTITAGTLTLLQPANDSSNALLRIA